MRAFSTWALFLSLATHLGLVAWLLHEPPAKGAVSTGLGGVEVAMAPSGAMPGAAVPTAPPTSEAAAPVETGTQVEQAQPAEAVRPPPPLAAAAETELPAVIGSSAGEEIAAVEPSAARPVEPLTETRAVEAEPDRVTPPEAPAVEAEELPPPPPLAAATETELPTVTDSSAGQEMAAVEPPDAKPVEPVTEARPVEAEPVQVAPPEAQAVEARELRPAPTPAAKPVVRPRPRAVAQLPPPRPEPSPPPPAPAPPAPAEHQAAEPAPTSAPTSAPPGASGPADTGAMADAGSDGGPAGGGTPGPSPDYVSLVQAWLARHREYPSTARMRHQEGTALLRFVMDRQGRILSHRIERSSGVPALDRAVEEMLARAEPLPAMPPEIRSAQLELIVPVRFELR